jgi:hypothetical protein
VKKERKEGRKAEREERKGGREGGREEGREGGREGRKIVTHLSYNTPNLSYFVLFSPHTPFYLFMFYLFIHLGYKFLSFPAGR